MGQSAVTAIDFIGYFGISLAFGHSRLLMKNSVVIKVELKMTHCLETDTRSQ
jgi:hypothetical protein